MPAGHAGGILSRARVHARLVSIELTLVIGSKEKIHGSESTSSYFVTMAANLHPHGSESTSTWQRIYIWFPCGCGSESTSNLIAPRKWGDTIAGVAQSVDTTFQPDIAIFSHPFEGFSRSTPFVIEAVAS